MQGNPTVFRIFFASSRLWAKPAFGVSRPIFFMHSAKSSLSSALSIASFVAPINSTLNSFRTPCLFKSSAAFRPVCPPIVGKIASGFSCEIIFFRDFQLIGSI